MVSGTWSRVALCTMSQADHIGDHVRRVWLSCNMALFWHGDKDGSLWSESV